MLNKTGLGLAFIYALLAVSASGCFYPPLTREPTEDVTKVTVPLPYDLAWDAVHAVIRSEDFHIQVEDSNHGIIEAQGKIFTLRDADCGRIKSIISTYPAQPEPGSSSVFEFHVKAVGNESSSIMVLATFESPLKVPLHPTQDIDCISHGAQESRLLREILAQARVTHPPVFKRPGQPAAGASVAPSQPPPLPGHPSLLRPNILK
ncbi:MAG TPA: hypothetical protein VIX12_07765 [Candidatus Binataceae bacterium]